MNEPQKRSNDLERSKFCQQVQSFVCVYPWRLVTFKFWEMLKNASEATLVPKIISFLKILCANFRGVRRKPGWRYAASVGCSSARSSWEETRDEATAAYIHIPYSNWDIRHSVLFSSRTQPRSDRCWTVSIILDRHIPSVFNTAYRIKLIQ